MIRKLTLYVAFCSLFCAVSNAQNNMPSALDRLATQCQQVIELNDTINARQVRLDEVERRLNDLKHNWLRTCNEVISSPACDDNETRINALNELIRLTDPVFEAGLLAQLKEACNNSTIRKFTADRQPLTPPRQGRAEQRKSTKKENASQPRSAVLPELETVTDPSERNNTKNDNKGKVENPITEEQPIEVQSPKKDESTTSPTTNDSDKGNTEKQSSPEKKDGSEEKDKTKIDLKDRSNRNKTIELMNSKNKNKNR